MESFIIFLMIVGFIFWLIKNNKNHNNKIKNEIFKSRNFDRKTFEFKVNLINKNFLKTLDLNSDFSFKLDIQDKKELVDVLIDNTLIGTLKKSLFDEVRFYFNNDEYVYDSTIEVKDNKNGKELFIIIKVVKYELSNELKDLIKDEEKAEEFSPYAKSFGESEFLEMKAKKFDSKYLFPRKDLEPNGHLFYGKKVVITGGFESFIYREKLAKILWELGADIDQEITKNVDFALVGNFNVGPKKMEKIIEFGIRIIREKELLEIINYEKT